MGFGNRPHSNAVGGHEGDPAAVVVGEFERSMLHRTSHQTPNPISIQASTPINSVRISPALICGLPSSSPMVIP
jgi:hypothetical protein